MDSATTAKIINANNKKPIGVIGKMGSGRGHVFRNILRGLLEQSSSRKTRFVVYDSASPTFKKWPQKDSEVIIVSPGDPRSVFWNLADDLRKQSFRDLFMNALVPSLFPETKDPFLLQHFKHILDWVLTECDQKPSWGWTDLWNALAAFKEKYTENMKPIQSVAIGDMVFSVEKIFKDFDKRTPETQVFSLTDWYANDSLPKTLLLGSRGTCDPGLSAFFHAFLSLVPAMSKQDVSESETWVFAERPNYNPGVPGMVNALAPYKECDGRTRLVVGFDDFDGYARETAGLGIEDYWKKFDGLEDFSFVVFTTFSSMKGLQKIHTRFDYDKLGIAREGIRSLVVEPEAFCKETTWPFIDFSELSLASG